MTRSLNDMAPLWQWEFRDPGREPDVSIVIPVHNNLNLTMQCLWSMHEAQGANLARAEVIVVDDASTDRSSEWLSQIRGIRTVTLAQNVGYLRATNAGIAASRGRAVHLLNNDTLLNGAWLDPLIDTMRRRGALAVGSKLVYQDGSVQEAGSIIFSDGSGWNYGRGLEPDDPRIGYERRVDYCSAASLLVDGEFLRGRGGFDLRYTPAYYEDTDLCFAVREAGGNVWYQPRSVVVHLEGGSHGTDETSGVKAHQVINRETFIERHHFSLMSQQKANADVVPCARERVRRRVLVIDNEVPTPDRDSGSLRLFSIMTAMVELGIGVTFMPANGWRRSPYTERLEAAGIEVLGVPAEWWDHIAQIGPTISHVWLSRPGSAGSFLTPIRERLPDAHIIYDTVDLHFLREQRGAQVQHDPVGAAQARRLRETELALMRQADTVVVVSTVEQELLRTSESIDSVLIPNVHEDRNDWSGIDGRSTIVFVGGFRHPPNVDAVRWLAESIQPRVRDACPDARLLIVGSDLPADLAHIDGREGIEVLGWVPDVAEVYFGARVAVAPLRYGAGVKGKVGEAMSFGVPMVLTPIAAEGMPIVGGRDAILAETAEDFAQGIVTLLTDDAEWASLAVAARTLVASEYGHEATARRISELLLPGEPLRTTRRAAVVDDGSATEAIVRLQAELARVSTELSATREAASALTQKMETLRAGRLDSEVVVAGPQEALVANFQREQLRQRIRPLLERDALERVRVDGRSFRAAARSSALVKKVAGSQPALVGAYDAQRVELLMESGLIDDEWYLDTYPDVASSGLSAFDHYVLQGWRERRSPGPLFDSDWYLATTPGVEEADVDPLYHYLVWGWREGRSPNRWFDSRTYAGMKGITETDVCPLVHYASSTHWVRRYKRPETVGRKVVLHIGAEGTGSTYLQRDLAWNRDRLAQQGWSYGLFLGDSNHHALAAYAVDLGRGLHDFHEWNGVEEGGHDAYVEEFTNRFREATREVNSWVFSSEHLSTWAQVPDIERIAALFEAAGLEPTIVFYARRQDFLIPSTFSTAVKAGATAPFNLETMLAITERYDFADLYRRWNAVFEGRVVVRPYAEGEDSNWLTDDFLGGVLELSLPSLRDWDHPQHRTNRSLSGESVEALREANIAVEAGRMTPFERDDLAARLDQVGGEPLRLTPEQRALTFERYRESNEWLCALVDREPLTHALLGESARPR